MKIINIENPKEGDTVFISGSRWVVLYNNCSGNKKYLVQNKENEYRFIDKIDKEIEVTIYECFNITNNYFKEGDFLTLEYSDEGMKYIYIFEFEKDNNFREFYFKRCVYKEPDDSDWRYYNDGFFLNVDINESTLGFSTNEEIKKLKSYENNI